ncbi:glycosyltransferase family 9 protein [Desulfovibrio sp. OttesenSCG-928-G11]|nr:glycosyltransferase family 9 protein [Desulfovibrio sp. OttesenSCG-928-G11]
MNAAPILVLQMQRMGDLVLSFPLLARLAALYPEHPIWVVGERAFYEPLLDLSPRAVYFSYEAAPGLKRNSYRLILNLSHRQKAARLAGSLESGEVLGPIIDKSGRLFIRGDWQIYRASLTDNNRYNLFHWADLNCLDLMRPKLMLRTVWTEVRPALGQGARIGLFLGASQPEKHPDAAFWTSLCRSLLTRGFRPALLGGRAEADLGRTVAAAIEAPALNLCGRFSVGELAAFLGRLDLLVTPDTGPMHVAAWIGTPCLNLSLGPVNAWETGPFAPGHLVLRAALDCAGCWQCTREAQFCREKMNAQAVAAIVAALCMGRDAKEAGPDLDLSRTRRDSFGLFDLVALHSPASPARADLDANPKSGAAAQNDVRMALARFWQRWFMAAFAYADQEAMLAAASVLGRDYPAEAARLAAAAAAFALRLAKDAKFGRPGFAENPESWRAFDPVFQPFSGYAQMYAQNEGRHPAARRRLLDMAESLASLFVGGQPDGAGKGICPVPEV